MGVNTTDIRDYFLNKVKDIKESTGKAIDKKVATSTAKDLFFIEELQRSIKDTFSKGWSSPPRYQGKVRSNPQRIVNLLLSDLHFGSHIDSSECPYEYNTIQESRRLGRVASQIVEYKRQYRKESKLIIHLLGDVIQGQLHDLRDGEPLAQQFNMSLHYLIQFVMFVCSQYPEVEVYCTPGNHGRNLIRHPERAVNQKWDSIETMIYIALKMAVLNSGITNCKFFIPRTPYYTVQLFDNKGFFTHGDTVLKPGYPGRSINIASLTQQVMKWNTARGIGGPFHLFCCGHIHFGSVTNLPGNVVMVTNGCLVPPDSFSLSIGSPDVTAGQYMFESVKGHVVGDQRFIVVDGAENNPNYNNIIKPIEDS